MEEGRIAKGTKTGEAGMAGAVKQDAEAAWAKKPEEEMPEGRMTVERLRMLAETDVRTVDRAALVDIADVKVNKNLPEEDRILDYIRQIKNPYCYKCHGVAVKISFAGKKPFNECIKDAICI